jgi:cell division protein FtsQ
MKKKILSIFFIVLAIGGAGAIMAFSFIKKDNICSGVELKVIGDEKNGFVSKTDVEDLLNSLYVIRPGQTKTSEINTQKLEALIKANPYVTDANCYFVQSGKLMVDVEPKEPIIRVFNGENISYYLQDDGRIIPLSPNYVADVPVFTIDKLEATIAGQALKQKMLYVGKLLTKDELWNLATSEIHATNDGQFTMFSNIASHSIYLGDTSKMESKLDRLKYFYQEVLPKRGWDKYSALDLRYNGQIVATNVSDDDLISYTNTPVKGSSNSKTMVLAVSAKSTIKKAITVKAIVKVPVKVKSSKVTDKKETQVVKTSKNNSAKSANLAKPSPKNITVKSKAPVVAKAQTNQIKTQKPQNSNNTNQSNTKGNDKK